MNLKIRSKRLHEDLKYWLEHSRTLLRLWRIELWLWAAGLEERIPFLLGAPLWMILY